MRRQKLHIGYENQLDSPKGRFWLFFLVRYLAIGVLGQKILRMKNICFELGLNETKIIKS